MHLWVPGETDHRFRTAEGQYGADDWLLQLHDAADSALTSIRDPPYDHGRVASGQRVFTEVDCAVTNTS